MKEYNADGSIHVVPVDDAITRIKHFMSAWGIEDEYMRFRFPGEFSKYFDAHFSTRGDAFAMTTEGEFVRYMDYHDGTSPDFDGIWRKFTESLGYFCERGHNWSWHFMPLPVFIERAG